LVVADIGDLALEREEIPGWPAEDARLLERVQLRVRVDAKRNMRKIIGRHREGGEIAFAQRHARLRSAPARASCFHSVRDFCTSHKGATPANRTIFYRPRRTG